MSNIFTYKTYPHFLGTYDFQTENTVILSSLLPSGFVESDLTLQNVVIGDDAYEYIQPVLNGGNLTLIWDKKVSLGNTLRIDSNTKIKVIGNNGAVLRAAVNRPMWMNSVLKFRENHKIVNENIHFYGGIWNGNGANQTTKGGITHGAATIFSFFGVKNLHLKNHTMYTPKTYAQQAINILYGVVEDFIVDVGDAGAMNMDGVHFDGWCNYCRISNGDINTYDDGAGCNADDIYYHPDYGGGITTNGGTENGFWEENPCGPASNIIFEDLRFNNSVFGIRVLSNTSRVDNIIIRNLSGTTKAYSVLIDYYYPFAATYGTQSGNGNIGFIAIYNNSTVVDSFAPTLVEGKIVLSASIDELLMNGITANTGNVPTFVKQEQDFIGRKFTYKNVILNGVKL